MKGKLWQLKTALPSTKKRGKTAWGLLENHTCMSLGRPLSPLAPCINHAHAWRLHQLSDRRDTSSMVWLQCGPSSCQAGTVQNSWAAYHSLSQNRRLRLCGAQPSNNPTHKRRTRLLVLRHASLSLCLSLSVPLQGGKKHFYCMETLKEGDIKHLPAKPNT